MKFTGRAALGIAGCMGLASCSDPSTIVSVSVWYWTGHLDPSTFQVTIGQAGISPVRDDDFAPPELPDPAPTDGRRGYAVDCRDATWGEWQASEEVPANRYCGFFKRYVVDEWISGSTTVTFRARTRRGDRFEPRRDGRGVTLDPTQLTFGLVKGEVNVVSFELDDSMPDPSAQPGPVPDGGAADGGEVDSGEVDSGEVSSGEVSSGVVDTPDAGGDAGPGASAEAGLDPGADRSGSDTSTNSRSSRDTDVTTSAAPTEAGLLRDASAQSAELTGNTGDSPDGDASLTGASSGHDGSSGVFDAG